MWKKLAASMLSAMLLIGSAATAMAQETDGTAPADTAATQAETAAPDQHEQKIVINLAARSLALVRDNAKYRLYPIGPGTAETPTPTGFYKILSKDVNPTWTSPSSGVSIPSGPDNPLGYRWMQFQGNYGIHGTNKPDSVGHYVSNGCVRMHESDVEELFDLVEVGTPVEITYNRVVVEKTPDSTIAYYIYPDGYSCQPLEVEDVEKWLDGFGVAGFVSDEDIEKKIEASDGEPTYIAKVYQLKVNGKLQKGKVVYQDYRYYLPAIDLADATGVQLGWAAEKQMLYSTYGKAVGYDKRDVLYCDSQGVAPLYHLKGELKDNVYELTSINEAAASPAATTEPQSHKSLQDIYAEATRDGHTVTGDDQNKKSQAAASGKAKKGR